MSTIASQIANACYLAIALHFVRRIVNKKPVENPALDALMNLPEEARLKIYSDIYAKPEFALVGYKGKHGFKGKVIDTGIVTMPYIKPQELKDANDRMIGKSPEAPIMFIPPKDIRNNTDKRPGY